MPESSNEISPVGVIFANLKQRRAAHLVLREVDLEEMVAHEAQAIKGV